MKNLLILIVFISFSVTAQVANKVEIEAVPFSVQEGFSASQVTRIEKLVGSETYLSVSLIKFENIEKLTGGNSHSFSLPGRLGKINVKSASIDFFSENNYIWKGELPNGNITLYNDHGRIYGQIRKDGAVYDIQYIENNYALLLEYDMKIINNLECGTPDNITTNNITVPTGLNPAARLFNPNPLIKVLVLYTPSALATGINLTDAANSGRSQWVSAQINSSVYPNLEIVGVEPLEFNETSTINIDIVSFRNDTEAQQLRDQFEADLVVLFTDGNYGDVTGRAFTIGPLDDGAYAIVQVEFTTSNFTFIHEIGHLFGARHNFPTDDEPGDVHGHDWKQGIWPFRNEYKTIMSVRSSYDRINYFSNPLVDYIGKPTGVTGASDNRTQINLSGLTVSQFRTSQPSMSVSIYGPATANNGDQLTFSSGTSSGQSPYSYQWESNAGSGYYNSGTSSTLNTTMPTNNNLEIRLTVTDANNQQDFDYMFVQNLYLNGGCTVCPDSLLNDTNNLVVELGDLDLKTLVAYPVPAKDYLEISVEGLINKDSRIQVLDSKGIIYIEKELMDSNSIILNVSRLSKGVYFIKYISNSGQEVVRFLKE